MTSRRNEKKKPKTSDEYEYLKEIELLFEYDLDRDNRTIYFNGDVDEMMVDRTIKSLFHLESQGKEPIKIRICSYGGSIDHMFALYDIIRQCDSHIITIGVGAICSAAVLLLACGDERHASENSWLMGHKATGGSFGDADQVHSGAVAFKKYEAKRYKLLAKHSKLTAKAWKKKEQELGEVWMEPDDMLKSGIVDSILPSKKVTKKRTKKKK